jgi:hypothetical protein
MKRICDCPSHNGQELDISEFYEVCQTVMGTVVYSHYCTEFSSKQKVDMKDYEE